MRICGTVRLTRKTVQVLGSQDTPGLDASDHTRAKIYNHPFVGSLSFTSICQHSRKTLIFPTTHASSTPYCRILLITVSLSPDAASDSTLTLQSRRSSSRYRSKQIKQGYEVRPTPKLLMIRLARSSCTAKRPFNSDDELVTLGQGNISETSSGLLVWRSKSNRIGR